MSPARARATFRAAALTLTGFAGGCDVVALSFDGSTGLVLVLIEDRGGRPSGGYRIRTRQAGRTESVAPVIPGREVRLVVEPGEPVELTLLAPPGCRATSPNPQTVVAPGDGHVTVRLSASCGTE